MHKRFGIHLAYASWFWNDLCTYRKVSKCPFPNSGVQGRAPIWQTPWPWAMAAYSAMSAPHPASVCADHHPDQLWGRLAVHLPSRLVVFPDWIHDFSDRPLHKLLHSGKSHSSVVVGIWGPCSQGPHSFLYWGAPALAGAGWRWGHCHCGRCWSLARPWSSGALAQEALGPCGKAELSHSASLGLLQTWHSESQSQSLSPTALNSRAKLNIWRIFRYSTQLQIEINPFPQFSYTSSPHCSGLGAQIIPKCMMWCRFLPTERSV